MSTLTAERLRELLHYDPESGHFYWRTDRLVGRGRVVRQAGSRAGWEHKASGYWLICIDSTDYRASRLAWLYVKGEWPQHQIDHRDTDRSNNRWLNLRDITQQFNLQNLTRPKGVVTNGRLLGTYFNKKDRSWNAAITVNYKKISLGSFPTTEEAHEAYVEAKRRLHGGCTL